ncbi:hypothetical protein EGW08_015146 [Elysia chlorotica]|uniref:beta-N-acetylhexosaminidase n=1 Tax=Elysia chlorotica TaxID=188477 RepID=A0A433T6C5_ELYCH|nr:hypothetical protein EGW08_015146 [Elysia chlorotica]
MKEVDDIVSEYKRAKRRYRLVARSSISKMLKRYCSRWYGVALLALIGWTCGVVVLVFASRLDSGVDLNYKLPFISKSKHLKKLSQADLDHFASTIRLNYTVLENSYKGKKLFLAEILLTNTGRKVLPAGGWAIIFSQPYTLEPEQFPYPDGVEKREFGVRFHFFSGNVYRMTPISGFRPLAPGRVKAIRFVSEHHCVSRTDVHPNWYFTGPNLQPRIIESTRGESLDFVAPFNRSGLWKRNIIKGDKDYDWFHPFTPADRARRLKVQDLGRAPTPVIPTPVEMVSYNPRSTLTIDPSSWVIVSSPSLANEARFLSDHLGVQMTIRQPGRSYIALVEAGVQVNASPQSQTQQTQSQTRLVLEEAYDIEVNPRLSTIIIRAPSPSGAFNGVQTLLSLRSLNGTIPEVRIRDAPRYRYRGLMLDVARNFHSKERIFRYLDVMAMYKLNKLHLHLTDDEGWRLEIPGLEELTQVGSQRCHDLKEQTCLLPFLGSGPFTGPPGSGFYTVADYRDILRYAASRHIEVIPEIDMPAHSHAAIAAMEARHARLAALNFTEAARFLLSDLQDESKYLSIQSFNDGAVNPCLRSTYTFINRVLTSLVSMHRDISPLRTYNFGGDEVPKGTWQKSPVCAQLRQSGVSAEPKRYLASQIANMTSLYNLDLAAWEDGITSQGQPMRRNEFPNRNVYVYTWNNVWEWGGMKHAYEYANKGFKVVMTPATNLYLDHAYEPDPEERGLFWATRYSDTKKVFSTMPENLYLNADTYRSGLNITICQGPDVENQCPTLNKPENIEGIQGSLFGELLRTQWESDFMLLPRMLALAERAWHKAPWEAESDPRRMQQGMESDWQRFSNSLGHRELSRLDRLGFQYRLPPPGAEIVDGFIQTSVTFPGLPVEISDDAGSTWRSADGQNILFDPSKSYQLRTRAPFGERFSRVIYLTNMASAHFSALNYGIVCNMAALTVMVGCVF